MRTRAPPSLPSPLGPWPWDSRAHCCLSTEREAPVPHELSEAQQQREASGGREARVEHLRPLQRSRERDTEEEEEVEPHMLYHRRHSTSPFQTVTHNPTAFFKT
ncbi:hypothetical protein AAFF_G00224760 [Aldrovandia affinis]|uniref:Uncharacterized protein n=1 Tax=Aldrovandia affinis TaxID=143900 RepID=A0AAD7TC91_9TELE|nr:hypothetical protein AAFF_G00224760 [Aldrovandia affinis]